MKAKYLFILVVFISFYGCLKYDSYYNNLNTNKHLGYQLADTLVYSGTVSVFADSVHMDSIYIDSFYIDTIYGDTIDSIYLDSIHIDSIYVDSMYSDTFVVSSIDSGYRNYADYYNYQYNKVEFSCINSDSINDKYSLYCENILFEITWDDFYLYDYFVSDHKIVNYTWDNQTISDVYVLSQSGSISRVYFHPNYGILQYKKDGNNYYRLQR
jgi:hypothetical protein